MQCSVAVLNWVQGLIPSMERGKEFFSSPPCPDRLWGSTSLLFKGYHGLFPRR